MPYKINAEQKEWLRKQAARNRQRNRAYVQAYLKEHPCIKCGESDPVVLDFHHRDPKTKDKTISRLIGYSLQRLINEIEKCDVLCANDHRRRHHKGA